MMANNVGQGGVKGGGRGGGSHTHRHGWRVVLALKGVEEVSAQLPVIPWGPRRIANAT